MALMIGGVVGGTFAWLTASTDPVVNTFTYGNIDLKLEETKLDEEGKTVDENADGQPDKTEEGNVYKMKPGEEYLKDPVVTVAAGNEDCWLFVELKEQGGITITNGDGSKTEYTFDDYLEYEVLEDWLPLKDEEGNAIENVFYRYVEKNKDESQAFEIMKDSKIVVKEDVDSEMLNLLDNNGQAENAAYPGLAITSYAVQYFHFEPEVENEGDKPTDYQRDMAALKAWNAIAEERTTVFVEEAEETE